MFGWRKACSELTKRMDPQLAFYYHTSTHHRFYEGDLERPDLSKPRNVHIARRELLAGGLGGRITMVQHGARSIRSQYHNLPVELPPPPGMSSHIVEHSY